MSRICGSRSMIFSRAQVAQVEQDGAPSIPRPSRISVVIRPRHDVAGGELQLVGRVLAHEALALGVHEVAALAAGGLRHQHAARVERGGVELHELHVLQRHAGAEREAHAVAGGAVRVRGVAVRRGRRRRWPSRPPSRRSSGSCRGPCRRPRRRGSAPCESFTSSVTNHLDVRRDLVLHQHRVQRVEDTRPVRSAPKQVRGKPAPPNGPLGDLPVVSCRLKRRPSARSRRSPGRPRRDLDGVLVGEVVGALDGVEGVVLGRVVGLVAQRGVDAALRGARVAAHGVNLRHQSDVHPCLVRGDGRSHPGEARADDDDVMAEQCPCPPMVGVSDGLYRTGGPPPEGHPSPGGGCPSPVGGARRA